MSGPASSCPGCGAPVKFTWSSAVQAACPFCKAILVRHDVDLEKVGEIADLPQDASPIQLMASGQVDNRSFMVIGRIRYEWDQGSWNEWHLLLNDQSSGWLSDAQLEYAVSYQAAPPLKLPPSDQIKRGHRFKFNDAEFAVTHLTRARYVGFEGELPFRTDERDEILFADLRTHDGRFATIDYSEEPPLLYLGRSVTFNELKLQGLREFEGW
jgi:hypothetical protein